ncbi:hypothetical protein [Pseudomonas kurunegalensis]|uniref:Uncharacterized protein n=1 Tax=Pseudomonas kurunegalensis TaxID=485880 RepID=A0ACC5UHK5_9PSED|nr:hypothetical protein [Pseudomonas kurunegalensis]MBV4513855.1 hypothetical protein [Pseudomonas kurunegalensis]
MTWLHGFQGENVLPKIRVAIIESPNPIDLFAGRSEARALEATCKLMGHEAISFVVKSRMEFKDVIKFLASSDSNHDIFEGNIPLFLHISSHGNTGCVAIGGDEVKWGELLQDLTPLLMNSAYEGQLAISISACGSGGNSVSNHAVRFLDENPSAKIPAYIFSILGEHVNWDDALIGWSLLYHMISRVGIRDHRKIIQSIKKIAACTDVEFSYRRWSAAKQRYCMPKMVRPN